MTGDFEYLEQARRVGQADLARGNYAAYFDRLAEERNQAAVRTNSARDARSVFKLTTNNLGQRRHPTPLTFDTTFVEEPTFSTGSAVVRAPDPAAYADPVAMVGLRSWVRNEHGHYVGVYIYYRVDIARIDGTLGYYDVSDLVVMVHHLTFTGIGYKAVGPRFAAEADNLAARVRHVNWGR